MMASNANFPAQSTQAKRTSFGGYPGSNASLLLEKAKAGIRRSTPDSEALASSDDEQDQHHQHHSMTPQSGSRGARRSSWLNEFQQATQRKASLSGSGTFSPASSHPTTPIADQTSWLPSTASTVPTSAGRVHSSSTSFPWGSTIWNNDNQKGPPSRLTEVLPSPTTINPPTSAAFYGDDPLLSPPINRDGVADSAIPFAIPLHPTPKTYRSQSYSVGQLDPESAGAFPSGAAYPLASGRGRAGSSYTSLQHRPSRPSMLGEFSHDTPTLGQLREVEDDDDESSNASEAGVQLTNAQARTIEQLAMENAFLRQAAASHQQNTTPTDPMARNSVAHLLGTRLSERIGQQQYDDRKTGNREYARVEVESLNLGQAFDHNYTAGRRLSEFYANPGSQYPIVGTLENRKLESVKKGHWQSSLGFGGLAEAPQSRRHSFADVPTRHGSISSTGELQGGLNGARGGDVPLDEPRSIAGYGEGLAHSSQTNSTSYFSNMDPSLRNPDLYRSANSPSSVQQPYPIQGQYNRPTHGGPPQPHLGQLLCMVTFKACRAEVYYVQEGTGLQVKTGDLVIVEADRGTDLGTVAYHNITWAMAKELKESFIEEHYKWLMMFSRHGQNGNTATVNQNGSVSSMTGAIPSAVGGMGPAGQFPAQDSQNVELKPKMIKRVAQPHEIQTLRDKEANEAKAKRVCQQKVVEHRLNMEILDAEFQMDWKKLTFYYFADSYINFNSLVTDLFKIYKTRIWMSAINPASFVTPSLGLNPLPNLGPPNADRDHFTEARVRKENFGFTSNPLSHNSHGPFDQIWSSGTDSSVPSSMLPSTYPQLYGSQGMKSQVPNSNLSEYSRGVQPLARSHSPFSYQGNSPFRAQSSTYTNAEFKNVAGRQAYAHVGSDWNKAFYGLSLGS